MPERSTIVLPNDYRPLSQEVSTINDVSDACSEVALSHTSGLTLLRIGAHVGQTAYYTYLWYNYSAMWEVEDQTVQNKTARTIYPFML